MIDLPKLQHITLGNRVFTDCKSVRMERIELCSKL